MCSSAFAVFWFIVGANVTALLVNTWLYLHRRQQHRELVNLLKMPTETGPRRVQ